MQFIEKSTIQESLVSSDEWLYHKSTYKFSTLVMATSGGVYLSRYSHGWRWWLGMKVDVNLSLFYIQNDDNSMKQLFRILPKVLINLSVVVIVYSNFDIIWFTRNQHHPSYVNTLRPRQNGRHFPDVIFKCIFLNEDVWILIKISLNFFPGGPNNNFPALVQIIAWRRPGDKPLSELMMVSLLTHICVTRPQWVNIG